MYNSSVGWAHSCCRSLNKIFHVGNSHFIDCTPKFITLRKLHHRRCWGILRGGRKVVIKHNDRAAPARKNYCINYFVVFQRSFLTIRHNQSENCGAASALLSARNWLGFARARPMRVDPGVGDEAEQRAKCGEENNNECTANRRRRRRLVIKN